MLDQSRVPLTWAGLGFSDAVAADIRKILAAPNGIFLAAGPTGSGKTTTLYTALSEMNSISRKIVSVEDPVEYSLPGIAQVQVDPEIDMTFARALRAILRQDPDVILIGEIRDQETAEIAVRAALVGRLVLSTVHTNDSVSAITRLSDLGIPRYLLGATLRGVLSQRLVKQRGGAGRTVIAELLKVSGPISDLISKGSEAPEILEEARRQGFKTLAETAEPAILAGLIDPLDIERAVGTADG